VKDNVKCRTKLVNKRHRCCGANTSIVELIEYDNGAIAFSESDIEESFVYLYPEQIEQLHLRLIARLREKAIEEQQL
jgi:hypothetical protein